MFSFSNFTFVNLHPHVCRFRAGLTFAKKLKHFSVGKSFIKTSKNCEIRETFSSKLSFRKLVRAKQINAVLKAVDIKYHDFKKFAFSFQYFNTAKMVEKQTENRL